MKTHLKSYCALLVCTLVITGCATDTSSSTSVSSIEPSTGRSASRVSYGSNSMHAYKLDLAQRIASVNAGKMYTGRPQALLRSVVVLKYVVDAQGNLTRSEVMRSNRDRATEATALASLRSSAPFPKPAASLLQRGQVELSETWLFNNDGRFQLRTTAQKQMDE